MNKYLWLITFIASSIVYLSVQTHAQVIDTQIQPDPIIIEPIATIRDNKIQREVTAIMASTTLDTIEAQKIQHNDQTQNKVIEQLSLIELDLRLILKELKK